MQTNWLDISEYPFTSRYFKINGHRLHYIDEGQGEAVVFVHGTPSWSFDYRHLIKALRQNYRCIALDHMGFGLSDKPADYDYAYINHCETLERFLNHLQLKRFTLVVHDFGGPIGFTYAQKNPAQIKKLIVFNTWMWSGEGDMAYEKLKRLLSNPLLPLLYKYLNFSPRFVMPASFGAKKLSKHLLKQYTGPFLHRHDRLGPLAFAKALLVEQPRFDNLWQNRNSIRSVPALLIWGMRDPAIPPTYLIRMQQVFEQAQTLELPSCGHFPQEENHEVVINKVIGFLNAT